MINLTSTIPGWPYEPAILLIAVELTLLSPSLLRVLVSTWKWNFIGSGIYLILENGLSLTASGYLLQRFLNSDISDFELEEWLMLLALMGTLFAQLVFQNLYLHDAARVGIRIRAALLMAVYKKALRISSEKVNLVEIINLQAKDCNQICVSYRNVHCLWDFPLLIIGVCGIMVYSVGIFALIGTGIIVLFLAVQLYVGHLMGGYREKANAIGDCRIGVITEILNGIEQVKLNGWQSCVGRTVDRLRKAEQSHQRTASYLNSVTLSFSNIAIVTAIFSTVVTVYLMENQLDPVTIFTVITLFQICRDPLVQFPEVVQNCTGRFSISQFPDIRILTLLRNARFVKAA